MLRKLNMYGSDFENPFLDQTNEFYRVKGDIQLNDSSVSKHFSLTLCYFLIFRKLTMTSV